MPTNYIHFQVNKRKLSNIKVSRGTLKKRWRNALLGEEQQNERKKLCAILKTLSQVKMPSPIVWSREIRGTLSGTERAKIAVGTTT